MAVEKPNELIGKTETQLRELLSSFGEPAFRARQIFAGIYKRRAASFDALTDLPKSLRERLSEACAITSVRVAMKFDSSDGTRRYLLGLADGAEAETVFMPEERRDTICISSQVGCPLACDFCMTGILGLTRNLSPGEIVSQVIVALNDVYGEGIEPARPTNIVMMGMGEPLLNYDSALSAVRLFSDPNGLNIPARRITLSTAGIVPRMTDLARETIRPRLAISLSAASDDVRNRLFPISRKYPLNMLMDACRAYPLGEREKLTFEYVMLDGVNDSDLDARLLVKLLAGIKAKVNLIPHNPAPELNYGASPMERIVAFQNVLKKAGVDAFIRRPRGRDISAACGQLAARHSSLPLKPETVPA